MRNILFWLLVCGLPAWTVGISGAATLAPAAQANEADARVSSKQQAMNRLRQEYAQKQFRGFKLKTEKTLVACLELLSTNHSLVRRVLAQAGWMHREK